MKWHRYSCCFFHLCSQMICRHCSEQQELLSLVQQEGRRLQAVFVLPLKFCTCLLCFACQHNTTTWFCCHQVDIILFSVVWKLRSWVVVFVCLMICIVTKKDCSGTLALGWVNIFSSCFGCPFTSLQKELLTEQTLDEPQYQWNAMMMKMRPSAALSFIWVGHWTWIPVVHDITY